MDGDADHHGYKGKTASGMNMHAAEHVVIQYTIIETLAGCPMAVDAFPLIAVTFNPRIKTNIIGLWNIDRSAIISYFLLALLAIRTGFDFSACERAAVFIAPLYLIILGKVHFSLQPAEDISVGIIGESLREAFRIKRGFEIQIYKGDDTARGEKFISGNIVMG